MTEERNLFRNLLLWAWDTHQKPWEYVGRPREIREKIERDYPSFRNREDLESLLAAGAQGEGDFADRRKFLYLEPLVEGGMMLPVLSARWNFGASIPEVRLRVGLFLLDQAGNLASFGYRFEGPEGEGKHHYCHSQLIRAFDKSGTRVLSCPEWLPTSQPTFP